MGVLKSVEQGWSLLRILAQSEAVKDARDRVLNRIAEQAERISQSGLVPRVISAPAEIVAELIARRPPKPVEASAEAEAASEPETWTASRADAPQVDEPARAPAREPEPAAPPLDVVEVPPAPKPADKRQKPASSGKKAGAKAAGAQPKPPAAKTAKKPKGGSKKVRDKAGDLK